MRIFVLDELLHYSCWQSNLNRSGNSINSLLGSKLLMLFTLLIVLDWSIDWRDGLQWRWLFSLCVCCSAQSWWWLQHKKWLQLKRTKQLLILLHSLLTRANQTRASTTLVLCMCKTFFLCQTYNVHHNAIMHAVLNNQENTTLSLSIAVMLWSKYNYCIYTNSSICVDLSLL